MSDPTATVITLTFASALVIFIIGAVVKALRPISADPVQEFGIPEIEPEQPNQLGALSIPPFSPGQPENPYHSPDEVAVAPPAPPRGNVPTWFYNPFDLLGMGFVFMLFSGLVTMSLQQSEKAKAALNSETLLSSIGFQFIIAFIVMSFVLFRVRPDIWLGLKWKKWPWVFAIAPASVISMWLFFATLHFSGFMKWIESLGVETVQDTVKLLQESNDPTIIGLMVFAAVVAAPLCEEIVFRGYLYGAAKKFAGPWIGTVASALVFSAAHGSLAALLPLFVLGCLLVFLYEKTGSIWAPIAVHLLFNGATVLVQLSDR